MTFEKDPERTEKKQLHKYADFTGKRVLEIGSGEGRLTWLYAARSATTTGIDPDRDALRVATIDRPSDLVDQVRFAQALSEQLPFSKETFDMAVLAWSL
jgi:ubiquinone/menaquinone biosynthesis C-methylase UbiE